MAGTAAAAGIVPRRRPGPLWDPFGGPTVIGAGRDGVVVDVSPAIVLKMPRRYEDKTGKRDYLPDRFSLFGRERAVYDLMQARPPHPNVLQCFLSTPDGVFLPRMVQSLSSFLLSGARPSADEAARWAVQVSAAASWLESLDLYHGDLRPSNLLLDTERHVKVCDFASATHRGGHVHGAAPPFYMQDKAGPDAEQFAVGSCLYSIFVGHQPLSDIADPVELCEMLARGEFPSTDGLPLDVVILNCWNVRYETMRELHAAIASHLDRTVYENPAKCIPRNVCLARAEECGAWAEDRRAYAALCRVRLAERRAKDQVGTKALQKTAWL